ncbi:MAG: hypothetical protein E7409_04885 [Ruminococcaceae bacterium]|nr:hypothetical protein [Oscillospiraceae bacterium]
MKWFVALLLMLSMNLIPALAAEEADRPTGAEQKQIRLLDKATRVSHESVQENERIDMSLSVAPERFEGVDPDDYYGYCTLKAEDRKNGNHKLEEAYEDLAEGFGNKRIEIDMTEHRLTPAEFEKVFFACLGDFPQYFWLRSGYGYYLDDDDEYITEVLPDYEQGLLAPNKVSEFLMWAQTVLRASGVTPTMTDYEKAVMLHDELAARITYDYDALDAYNEAYAIVDDEERAEALEICKANFPGVHAAYGAMVKGRAVCDGYSKAYQYLLYRVGILSHVATGVANGGGHAWNLVLLDGDWYYTDLTWDDGVVNVNGTSQEVLFHAYFNMTTAQSEGSTHILDNPYAMPICTATQDSYFTKHGTIVNQPDADVVGQQLKKGPIVRLCVTGDMAEALKWMGSQDNIRAVLPKANLNMIHSWICFSSGNELFAMFVCDRVGIGENMTLEIGCIEPKKVKIYQAVYDENNVLVDAGMTEGTVDLQTGVTRVKANYLEHEETFKTVKYFLWDGTGGLKPLYDVAEMEY